MQVQVANKERLLRIEAVMARVGLGKSSIFKRVRELTFPAPCKLSRRYSAWPESSVDAWIKAQIKKASGDEN